MRLTEFLDSPLHDLLRFPDGARFQAGCYGSVGHGRANECFRVPGCTPRGSRAAGTTTATTRDAPARACQLPACRHRCPSAADPAVAATLFLLAERPVVPGPGRL